MRNFFVDAIIVSLFVCRPADCLVHGLDGPSPSSVHFSVVHALQPSADLADVHPGNLAAAVKRRKHRENGPVCKGAAPHGGGVYELPSSRRSETLDLGWIPSHLC
jgi:hypothetical protein